VEAGSPSAPLAWNPDHCDAGSPSEFGQNASFDREQGPRKGAENESSVIVSICLLPARLALILSQHDVLLPRVVAETFGWEPASRWAGRPLALVSNGKKKN
jgi:hypothetical protein